MGSEYFLRVPLTPMQIREEQVSTSLVPSAARAWARWALKVLFPTPPFPDRTKILCLTVASFTPISAMAEEAGRGSRVTACHYIHTCWTLVYNITIFDTFFYWTEDVGSYMFNAALNKNKHVNLQSIKSIRRELHKDIQSSPNLFFHSILLHFDHFTSLHWSMKTT